MGFKDDFLGVVLYGFCNGYFGRDSYDDKLIVGIGSDWVVVSYDDGSKGFASFDTYEEMFDCISKWRIEEEY